MKLLLWAILAIVIVAWLTRGKKNSSTSTNAGSIAPDASHKIVEPMVQCAYCGVHLPASESIAAPSGAVFCSEEHRLQHAKS